MTIAERISKIRNIRAQKANLNREEQDLSKPQFTDLDKIPSLFDKLAEQADPKNKDNTKMFIFIVFALYSPTSCAERMVRTGVRKRIAKLLRVSNSAVTIQFSDAKILYEKHRLFHAEVDRLYSLIIE